MKRAGVLVVVACALAASLMAPVSAAQARASITAKMSRNEVDPGVPVYVQGQVVGAHTAYVIVQRKMASGWYDRAQGNIDSNGRFSIRVRPTGTGIYAFRVVTAGRQLPSKTIYLRVWKSYLLYDMAPIDTGGCLWYKKGITLNARYYAYSMTVPYMSTCSLEYNLGRRYGRFQSAVGVDDNSKSGSKIAYRLLADGVQIASGTVALGSRQVVDVPVSGVLRLYIETKQIAGTGDSGWGNAKLKR